MHQRKKEKGGPPPAGSKNKEKLSTQVKAAKL